MDWFVKVPRLELSNWAPSENWEGLFERWTKKGVKGIILPLNLKDEIEKISSIIQLAKLGNVQVWVNLPVLNNQAVSDRTEFGKIKHRTGEIFDFPAWFAPICPSNLEYQDYLDEKIANSLMHLPIDVWLLDYVRFPYFWEQWGNTVQEDEFPPFCYCVDCKLSFQNLMHLSLEDSTVVHLQKWQSRVIEKLIERISRNIKGVHPNLRVGMQILPLMSQKRRHPKSEWVGQNLQSLQRHVDFFSPLMYGKLLGLYPDQILSYLVDFISTQKQPVVPSFQISSTRWDRQRYETKVKLTDLGNRLTPLGIDAATLFHAKDFLNPEKIQKE